MRDPVASFASWRLLVAVAALIGAGMAVFQLEANRSGLSITELSVGATPARLYRLKDAEPAPVVIIAHGFAGSRQLMEAYALTLARAGYVAITFDAEGHGRNPPPMSGDVTRVDGTTQMLMAEIGRIADRAATLPFADGRVALLGHSMASDIVVRQANADDRVDAVVAVSMFSEAVTADRPRNLLAIAGEWERFLRKEALAAVRLIDPDAVEGQTVGDFEQGTARRAVAAPFAEHVTVLYAPTALKEARDWLDAVFGRTGDATPAETGRWIVLLLVSIVALAWPLAGLLPAGGAPPAPVPILAFLLATLIPAVVAPLALALVDTRFLPVLVADYLAVHLLTYGLIALLILAWFGVRLGRLAWVPGLALAAYGIFVFGGALDRYVASFMPIPDRLPVVAAIAVGAVPYMLADALLCEGGRAAWWRVLFARASFLASLGLAVALDFERLFFLLIILPIIVLFYVVFGLMGAWVGRRTGAPFGMGLGLGLILAWAIGVTFPLFQPEGLSG